MRFTTYQYDEAIKALQDAKTQLEPDGDNCHVCGDSGHQAFECRHNPLFAMLMCRRIYRDSQAMHEKLHADDDPRPELQEIHDFLHRLAGYEQHMGEPVGPAGISPPFRTKEREEIAIRGGTLERTVVFSGGPLNKQGGRVAFPATAEVGDVVEVQGHKYEIAPNATTAVALDTGHDNLAVALLYVEPESST